MKKRKTTSAQTLALVAYARLGPQMMSLLCQEDPGAQKITRAPDADAQGRCTTRTYDTPQIPHPDAAQFGKALNGGFPALQASEGQSMFRRRSNAGVNAIMATPDPFGNTRVDCSHWLFAYDWGVLLLTAS